MKGLEQHLKGCPTNPKPTAKRSGIEAWFPYYAGYSSDFVREILVGLGAQPGWRILDPWNGAGTTTAVADSQGCDALGFDINPAAALAAAARLARADDTVHASGLASELLGIASRARQRSGRQDPLLAWLSPRLTWRCRGIANAILDLLGSRAGIRVEVERTAPPPFASFFLLCLIRAAKRFVNLKDNSNPTWTTPAKRGDAHVESLDQVFLEMIEAYARDAEHAGLVRASARATSSSIALGDARSLPLPNGSIDAVVTSPPYCTRIDYFRATLFELAALGMAPDSHRFQELRRKAMGTNLMRGERQTGFEAFSRPVQVVLERIREHPSKASSTYYFKSFAQYFTDAALSIGELGRVLKPGGCGVLVVQSSYYKDVPIPLGELYCSQARACGLDAGIVHRVPVRRVLATINSRAARHEPDRRYTEDVVVIQRVA